MPGLRICIDVDDLERGVAFYAGALGLSAGRRLGDSWVELLGAPSPIDLLAKPAGSAPTPGAESRHYGRHWTPLHLDFVIADLDAAMVRACSAGAKLEGEIRTAAWGRMANLADPFGHGFCLIEFRGRGYGEMAGLTSP